VKPLHWDEIDPATGEVYRWDSPNLTWSGILEPGDPGYVPPPNVSEPHPPKPKSRPMKHNSYFPSEQADQLVWLANFFNKLKVHGSALGLTTTVVDAAVADARWLIYLMGSWQPTQKTWSKACTDAMREAKYTDDGSVMTLPTFTAPSLPPADAGAGLPAVVAVKGGALNRIFSLVKVIKASHTYSESIGTDLGVIGTEDTAPDLATVQPQISVSLNGPAAHVDWSWQGWEAWLQLLRIQVDRDDGQGWRDLAYDTTPGYTDTAPQPTTLKKWKYRASFQADDAQVGLWSQTVEVIVGA